MIPFNKNWHFNMLEIYNFNSKGSFENLIHFIKENHNKIEGDIVEAGVYKGHSLISIAKLLKDLGSTKKVYGFDTFSGFPPIYHEKDQLKEFKKLFEEDLISENHFNSVLLNQEIIENFSNKSFKKDTKNISSSGEFENTNLDLLYRKIDYLELDNIVLVKGKFSESMKGFNEIEKIMSAVIDCDLYESYKDSLNFIWPLLSEGGFIHLDEYYSLKYPGARRATLEFIENINDAFLYQKSDSRDFERWHLKKEKLKM